MNTWVKFLTSRCVIFVLMSGLIVPLLEARKNSGINSSDNELSHLVLQAEQDAQTNQQQWAQQLLPRLRHIQALITHKASVKTMQTSLSAVANEIQELQQRYSDPFLDRALDWVMTYKPRVHHPHWKKNVLIAAVALVAAGVVGTGAAVARNRSKTNIKRPLGEDAPPLSVGFDRGSGSVGPLTPYQVEERVATEWLNNIRTVKAAAAVERQRLAQEAAEAAEAVQRSAEAVAAAQEIERQREQAATAARQAQEAAAAQRTAEIAARQVQEEAEARQRGQAAAAAEVERLRAAAAAEEAERQAQEAAAVRERAGRRRDGFLHGLIGKHKRARVIREREVAERLAAEARQREEVLAVQRAAEAARQVQESQAQEAAAAQEIERQREQARAAEEAVEALARQRAEEAARQRAEVAAAVRERAGRTRDGFLSGWISRYRRTGAREAAARQVQEEQAQAAAAQETERQRLAQAARQVQEVAVPEARQRVREEQAEVARVAERLRAEEAVVALEAERPRGEEEVVRPREATEARLRVTGGASGFAGAGAGGPAVRAAGVGSEELSEPTVEYDRHMVMTEHMSLTPIRYDDDYPFQLSQKDGQGMWARGSETWTDNDSRNILHYAAAGKAINYQRPERWPQPELWNELITRLKLNDLDAHGLHYLHYAVLFDNRDFLRSILPHVFPFAQDRQGRTPFHYAVQLKKSDIIEMYMPKYWEKLWEPDASVKTACHYAILTNQTELACRLIRLVPTFDSEDMRKPWVFSLWNYVFAVPSSRNNDALISLLEEKKCSSSGLDDQHCTPLEYAAFYGSVRGVELLASRTSRAHWSISRKNFLHYAALGGRFDCRELPFITPELLSAKDTARLTPLDYALQSYLESLQRRHRPVDCLSSNQLLESYLFLFQKDPLAIFGERVNHIRVASPSLLERFKTYKTEDDKSLSELVFEKFFTSSDAPTCKKWQDAFNYLKRTGFDLRPCLVRIINTYESVAKSPVDTEAKANEYKKLSAIAQECVGGYESEVGKGNRTLLHMLILKGIWNQEYNNSLFEQLCASPAINVKDIYGRTALHYALSLNDTALAYHLFSSSAFDSKVIDNDHNTYLHYVLLHGRDNISSLVEALITKRVPRDALNKDHKTISDIVSAGVAERRNDFVEIQECLRQHFEPLETNFNYISQGEGLKAYIARRGDLTVTDEYGHSLLEKAVFVNHVDAVLRLLAAGFEITSFEGLLGSLRACDAADKSDLVFALLAAIDLGNCAPGVDELAFREQLKDEFLSGKEKSIIVEGNAKAQNMIRKFREESSGGASAGSVFAGAGLAARPETLVGASTLDQFMTSQRAILRVNDAAVSEYFRSESLAVDRFGTILKYLLIQRHSSLLTQTSSSDQVTRIRRYLEVNPSQLAAQWDDRMLFNIICEMNDRELLEQLRGADFDDSITVFLQALDTASRRSSVFTEELLLCMGNLVGHRFFPNSTELLKTLSNKLLMNIAALLLPYVDGYDRIRGDSGYTPLMLLAVTLQEQPISRINHVMSEENFYQFLVRSRTVLDVITPGKQNALRISVMGPNQVSEEFFRALLLLGASCSLEFRSSQTLAQFFANPENFTNSGNKNRYQPYRKILAVYHANTHGPEAENPYAAGFSEQELAAEKLLQDKTREALARAQAKIIAFDGGAPVLAGAGAGAGAGAASAAGIEAASSGDRLLADLPRIKNVLWVRRS